MAEGQERLSPYESLEEYMLTNCSVLMERVDTSKLDGYYRLYPSGFGFIAVNSRLTATDATCVAYHEAGHHHTMIDGNHAKTEARADRWAVKKLVPIQSLIDALIEGCRNSHEVAEYLQVSEKFLYKTLDIYQRVHGDYVGHGKWTLWFKPLMAHDYLADEVYPLE